MGCYFFQRLHKLSFVFVLYMGRVAATRIDTRLAHVSIISTSTALFVAACAPLYIISACALDQDEGRGDHV